MAQLVDALTFALAILITKTARDNAFLIVSLAMQILNPSTALLFALIIVMEIIVL